MSNNTNTSTATVARKGFGTALKAAFAAFLGGDGKAEERALRALEQQAAAAPPAFLAALNEGAKEAMEEAGMPGLELIAQGGSFGAQGAVVLLHLWAKPASLKEVDGVLKGACPVYASIVEGKQFGHFLLGAPLEAKPGEKILDTEAYWQAVSGETGELIGERLYPGATPIKFKAGYGAGKPVSLLRGLVGLEQFRASGRGRTDLVVVVQLAGELHAEVNRDGAPTGFDVQPISAFACFALPKAHGGDVGALAARGSTAPTVRARKVTAAAALDAVAQAPVTGQAAPAPAPSIEESLGNAASAASAPPAPGAVQNFNPFASDDQL